MSTPSTLPAVQSLPLNPNCLRPGALAKLHDPKPAFCSGFSDDFRAGRYGRPFADIAKEARQ